MSNEQTTQIKNEHIIYGYGQTRDGKTILLVGLSHKGLDYLRDGQKTLTITPPKDFPIIHQVVFYSAPTKDDMKRVLAVSGIRIDLHELEKL